MKILALALLLFLAAPAAAEDRMAIIKGAAAALYYHNHCGSFPAKVGYESLTFATALADRYPIEVYGEIDNTRRTIEKSGLGQRGVHWWCAMMVDSVRERMSQ